MDKIQSIQKLTIPVNKCGISKCFCDGRCKTQELEIFTKIHQTFIEKVVNRKHG